MSRGHGVRGTALRAICPVCHRDIAVYLDRYALVGGYGITYQLMPHNISRGQKCNGWRVDKRDLVTERGSASNE